jgi:thiamine-monophosphate kinase
MTWRSVLDGVHFDSSQHSPHDIGRKAMNRNLSDCAAMACLPVAAVATVALPHGRGIEYAKQLYVGMRAAGEAFDCRLVGGDTGSWPGPLALTVTILGRADGVEPIRRSGAMAGDGIYVTGALGGSLLGRHMSFTPRVHEARTLARSSIITAMIDLSDGLSRDLRHICHESGIGVRLSSRSIPIHHDAITLSRRSGKPAIEHALHDGEDYELLFTASAPPPIGQRIGTITAGRDIVDIDGQTSLDARGWEHTL